MIDRNYRLLREIRAALSRIAAGTFGICLNIIEYLQRLQNEESYRLSAGDLPTFSGVVRSRFGLSYCIQMSRSTETVNPLSDQGLPIGVMAMSRKTVVRRSQAGRASRPG